VAKICGEGKRERTRAFTELCSHYLSRDRFARPAKGNDKGKVEGLVKFSRATFMVPVSHADSFDDLNAMLADRCRARRSRRSPCRGDGRTAGGRPCSVAAAAGGPAGALREVFSQRYERGSTIVTSNLPFEDWTQLLGSERLTGALLDRLTHRVSILTMNGDSYRLKQSTSRRRSAARAGQNQATEIIGPDTGEITTA
jgi:hypothetical protein